MALYGYELIIIQMPYKLMIITLFKFITTFCGTENILQNILVEYCQSHRTLLWDLDREEVPLL